MLKRFSLDGLWTLRIDGPGRMPGGRRTAPASVPGCVHTDLAAAGVIADPYWRDTSKDLRWITESNWSYERSFDVPRDLTRSDRVELVCRGLDPLCEIVLDGRRIGRADNYYRTWRFPVGGRLGTDRHTLTVKFASLLPYLERKYRARPLYQWAQDDPKRIAHFAYVRKPGYQFGWDWAPALVGPGIWRDIGLVGWDVARFAQVQVLQKHGSRRSVGLTVRGRLDQARAGARAVVVKLSFAGRQVALAEVPVRRGRFEAALEVPRPRLWWPNGFGEQPLYDLACDLLGGQGEILDRDVKRIGLRTVKLVEKDDRWGTSFQFEVNGVPIYAKGGNWVPDDCFPHRTTRDRLARFISECKKQHMNMLRVWGGGLYESDDFYDVCDELGILVWQDFMFACSTYPAHDPVFMENVRREAEDNVLRIRHHACLCLYCGNNELEEGLVGPDPKKQMPVKEYDDLFVRLLPSVVRAHDPATPYIRCSGHTPGRRRDRDHSFDIDRGDSHLWWVLRGHAAVVKSIDFNKLAKLEGDALQAAKWDVVHRATAGLTPHQQRELVPRFCSEFGRTSLPDVRTIASFTLASDRNPLHPVMEHHQQGSNQWMLSEVFSRFMPPAKFADLVTLSQLSHGEHFRWLVESWRRHKPRNMGVLHWTANDCWPAVEWATVDHCLRRKASFYQFKRFFAPVLVTGRDDPAHEFCDVYLVSDLVRSLRGRLDWVVTDLDGRILRRGGRAETAEARRSRLLVRLPFTEKPTDVLLWLDWEKDRTVTSSNLVLFCAPRALLLRRPTYDLRVVRKGPCLFDVTVRVDRPALYTALVTRADRDADWSDNFVHVRPGKAVTVTVRTRDDRSAGALRASLACRSLADMYPG